MRNTLLRLTQPRAITYTQNGSPTDVLRVSTLPSLPAPSPAQIAVKFLLSPYNPADMNVVQGVYPARPQTVDVNGVPHNLGGNEAVAEVVQVGEGVKHLQPSDRVIMGASQLGTWRSSALLNSSDVIKLPPSPAVSTVHAATLAINPPTALRMLSDYVQLRPGDYVIQNGANSAVGTSVIQIAKSMNVHTINLVRERGSSEETEALVQELKNMGATHVLTNEQLINDAKNARRTIKEWTQGKDLKLALNCVGGQETTELVKTLAEGAHLVTYGAMSKKPLSIPPGLHIFKDLKSVGFWMSRWYAQSSQEQRRGIANDIVKLIETGNLREPSHQIVRLGGHDQTDEQATQVLYNALPSSHTGGKKILFDFA